MLYLYIINIILSLIIICILYKKRNIENFVTWFSPLDKIKRKKFPKKYICRKYHINQKVVIGIYNYRNMNLYSNKFINKVVNIIKNQSNISNIGVNKYDTDYILYDKLYNGKIDVTFVPSPVIYHKLITQTKEQQKRYNPINFIACTNIVYIYFIVHIAGNIQSIHDIRHKKKIGIDKKTSSWITAKNMFDFLGLVENRDYVFHDKPYLESIPLLNSNKIDCFIQNDIYPSTYITQLFSNNLNNALRLLPLDEINDVDFAAKYKFYKPGFINLHKISPNYTPKVIGKFKYTTFKPILKTFVFNNYLLGGEKVNNNIGLAIITTLFNNISNINKLESMTYTPLDKYSLVRDFLYLKLNKGIIPYYYKMGYITDYDNKNCKYLVGNKKCSKDNLQVVTDRDFII